MEYTIRPVRCEDYQALQDIELAAFGACGYCNYFLKMIPHLFPTSCLLAEVNGQIAGYSLGAVDGHDLARAWILTAAVKPQFQNRGLGRELTCRLMQAMEERGARSFMLTVEPNNPARQLYFRLGFSDVKFERDCYGLGQDRYYMERKVEA
ncbi:MAG: GNAT family N-acetyltransferase [Selenomonadales bacterium]|nr:GNAT family N-acetyltransferase [Selenomonadales bacterium]